MNPQGAVAGVATFAGCNVDVATSYTLTATNVGLTTGVSSSFTVAAAAAAKLGFTTQPGNGTGGTALAVQPTVSVQDAFGNTVPGDVSSVTLVLTTPGTATLACTPSTTKAAVAGVAAFVGCNVNVPNSYTLTATDGSLTSAVSASFTISVGAAAKLAVTTQPSASTGGVAFGTQPAVTVQDAGGNTVTSDTSSVLLTLTVPGAATLACTAGNTKAAVAGVATFIGCKIDLANTYTLTATDTGFYAP